MGRGLLEVRKGWESKNRMKWLVGRERGGGKVGCEEGKKGEREVRWEMID